MRCTPFFTSSRAPSSSFGRRCLWARRSRPWLQTCPAISEPRRSLRQWRGLDLGRRGSLPSLVMGDLLRFHRAQGRLHRPDMAGSGAAASPNILHPGFDQFAGEARHVFRRAKVNVPSIHGARHAGIRHGDQRQAWRRHALNGGEHRCRSHAAVATDGIRTPLGQSCRGRLRGAPSRQFASSSTVTITMTGSEGAVDFAARIACSASFNAETVSITSRSTPPSARPRICSAKASRASSSPIFPSGSRRTPEGRRRLQPRPLRFAFRPVGSLPCAPARLRPG